MFATGRIKTCLHGPKELDLKGLLRSGASLSAITREIESVVYARPEQHFLNESSVAHRDFVMTHVGG